MTILEKIIGGPSRLKIIRFFLQNSGRVTTSKELSKMLQISLPIVSRELASAISINLIKRGNRVDIPKIIKDNVPTQSSKRRRKINKLQKKKVAGFMLSPDFAFFQPMYHLVIGASLESREKMAQYFKKRNGIQLIVLGGIFIQEIKLSKNVLLNEDIENKNQKLDLLIVANKIKKNNIEPFIKKIELEVGKELIWACFTTKEFEYRKAMHDKFLHDLFDYQHEILINKLGIE
ncbi:MAG: hypothetical protein AAB795_03385 [Patescibacteria group bacterium]